MTLRQRPIDKRIWLGAGAVAAAAALALWLVPLAIHEVGNGRLSPTHHLDGQGPLGSTGDPTSSSGFTFDTTSGSGPWTVGYLVCVDQGNDAAVIESIGPARGDGTGYHYIGGTIREFDPATGGRALIEVNGYPPTVPEQMRPAIGYAVTAPCSAETSKYTELDLGFTRAPGTDGGGWTGINIGYRVGSQQYVVTLGYDIYVCGPAIPNAQTRQACVVAERLTPAPTAAGL